MINPEELRLGNAVEQDGQIVLVQDGNDIDIRDLFEPAKISEHHIAKLSGEWVKRTTVQQGNKDVSGVFEHQVIHDLYQFPSGFEVNINYVKGKIHSVTLPCLDNKFVNIKSIHHLQNLHADIMGTELPYSFI